MKNWQNHYKNMQVQIKDYQIIKKAALEFIPGLNVIIGPSNNGKSSILKAIKAAVKSGLGYTIVTRDNVEKELKNKKLSIITPPDIEVMSMTSAVFLADSREREEVKEFIRILKEVWDETE